MLGEQVLQTRRMKAGSKATWQPDRARLCTDSLSNSPQQDRAADRGLHGLRILPLKAPGAHGLSKKPFSRAPGQRLVLLNFRHK